MTHRSPSAQSETSFRRRQRLPQTCIDSLCEVGRFNTIWAVAWHLSEYCPKHHRQCSLVRAVLRCDTKVGLHDGVPLPGVIHEQQRSDDEPDYNFQKPEVHGNWDGDHQDASELLCNHATGACVQDQSLEIQWTNKINDGAPTKNCRQEPRKRETNETTDTVLQCLFGLSGSIIPKTCYTSKLQSLVDCSFRCNNTRLRRVCEFFQPFLQRRGLFFSLRHGVINALDRNILGGDLASLDLSQVLNCTRCNLEFILELRHSKGKVISVALKAKVNRSQGPVADHPHPCLLPYRVRNLVRVKFPRVLKQFEDDCACQKIDERMNLLWGFEWRRIRLRESLSKLLHPKIVENGHWGPNHLVFDSHWKLAKARQKQFPKGNPAGVHIPTNTGFTERNAQRFEKPLVEPWLHFCSVARLNWASFPTVSFGLVCQELNQLQFDLVHRNSPSACVSYSRFRWVCHSPGFGLHRIFALGWRASGGRGNV